MIKPRNSWRHRCQYAMPFSSLLRVFSLFMVLTITNALSPKSAAAFDGNMRQLVPHSLYFVDASAGLSLSDVQRLPDEIFRQSSATQLNLGLTTAHLWLKFDRPTLTDSITSPLLVVPVPIIDDVVVYLRIDGKMRSFAGGDRSSFADRPTLRRVYLFPLSDREGVVEDEVYIRVRGDSAIRFRAMVTDETTFERWEATELVHRSLFYGLMFALLLYNMFLTISVRNRSQLYYLGYLVCSISVAGVVDGLPSYFGWAWWPRHANETAVLLTHALLLSGVQFVRYYLSADEQLSTRGSRLVWIGYGLAASMLASVLLGGRAAQILLLVAVAATLAGLAGTIFYHASKKVRQAQILTLTFIVLALPTAFWFARASGLADFRAFDGTILHIGFALEALLLSFALADRINYFRRQQRAAQRQLEESRRVFSQALLNAQDSERKQISRELHDSVGQTILALKTRLDRWVKQPNDDWKIRIDEAREVIEKVAQSSRELAHRLHPSILERLGLGRALMSLCESLLDAGIRVEHDLDAALDALDLETAIAVYRIFQGAISNVLRHAHATHCRLQATVSETGVVVELEDDGLGDGDAINDSDGFGVDSMRERARLIGASIRWTTGAAGGTRVVLLIANDSSNGVTCH